MSFINRLSDKFEAIGAEEINILDIHRCNSPFPKTVKWCSIEETRGCSLGCTKQGFCIRSKTSLWSKRMIR